VVSEMLTIGQFIFNVTHAENALLDCVIGSKDKFKHYKRQ